MVPTPRPPLLAYPDQYERCGQSGAHLRTTPEHHVDVFQAAKHGLLEECKRIFWAKGVKALDVADPHGYTPAHWAALCGNGDVIQFFLEVGCPVNISSRMEPAQKPIHCAAAKGHISVVHLLLEQGIALDTADQRGCTPLILAAQNGHAILCCYLISMGAMQDLCDVEGDNALHWAAFKGHFELTQLLIYAGLDPNQPDHFGQTPLHLAVLSGDLRTVQVLCRQDGIVLKKEDLYGNTALGLSQTYEHDEILILLQNSLARTSFCSAKFDWSALVFGSNGKSKRPILFFYSCLFFWGYPTYLLKIVSVSSSRLWELHLVFLLGNALMWFLFLKASLMDPGFLPRDSKEYDQAIRQAALHQEREGTLPLLSRLCHSCHLVRPLRAKHCRITDRCVEHFDHYCPYIYNAVGSRNRAHFFGFLATLSSNCFLGLYLCVDWFCTMGRSLLLVVGFIFMAVVAVVAACMAGTCQLYMASLNITTNEELNRHKYPYMCDNGGRLSSLFDRGVILNLLEFFHLIVPLTREELLNPSQLDVI